MSMRSLLVSVVLLGVAATPASADVHTISGRLLTYPLFPALGGRPAQSPERPLTETRKVTVQYFKAAHQCISHGSHETCICSFAQSGADVIAWSAPDGTYSANYTVDAAHPDTCTPRFRIWGHWYDREPVPAHRVVAKTAGNEVTNLVFESTYHGSESAFDITHDFHGVPELFSKGGLFWARRFGNGKIPLVIVEGWDPLDNTRSTLEGARGGFCDVAFPGLPSVCTSIMESFLKPVIGTKNLLDYLMSHDYTIWLLSSGELSRATMMGTAGASYTDGQAFQAAWLAKRIRDTYHAGYRIVVGGLSGGGLIVQQGLARWCNGTWAAATNPDIGLDGSLDAGCPSLAMWWAGDAPLEGAHAPVSIQRALKNVKREAAFVAPYISAVLDSPSTRELLVQWVTDGCECHCLDIGGCESSDSNFTSGCSINNSVRAAFNTWQMQGGEPQRGGAPVPAFAISYGSMSTPNCGASQASRVILSAEFDIPGPYNPTAWFRANEAGGTAECDPGSKLTFLDAADGVRFDIPINLWIVYLGDGELTVSQPMDPTFIHTSSSLRTSVMSSVWTDYWHPSANMRHTDPVPGPAARALVGWISALAMGPPGDPRVVCNHPNKATGLKPGQTCRPATLELASNGIDEDGDDFIDEVCPGNAEGWSPCQCGDGYCEPGENVQNCCQDCSIDGTSSTRGEYCRWLGLTGAHADSTYHDANALAYDRQKNLYVTGRFQGTIDLGNRITGGSALVTSQGGISDGYLAKYNEAGQVVWARAIGGGGYDVGHAVATDAAGDVYVAGHFEGTFYVPDVSGGLIGLTSSGYRDVFLIKFRGSDSLGRALWARRIGGQYDTDFSHSLAVDGSGNVVITGRYAGTGTASNGGGTTALPVQTGTTGLFVVKYAPAGTLTWARGLTGAAGGTPAQSVDVDTAGNVILAGSFSTSINFGGGALTPGGAYVARLDASGNHVWSFRRGAAVPADVAVDASGNAYVTGNFQTTTSFGGPTFSPRSGGTKDIYIAKYGADGSHVWSAPLGSTGEDYGKAVDVDAHGDVTFVGDFWDQIGSFGGGWLVSAGMWDVFVLKYSGTTGQLMSWWPIGGTGWERVGDVQIDPSGYPTVVGTYAGTVNFDGHVGTAAAWEFFLRRAGSLAAPDTVAGDLTIRPMYTPEVCDGQDNDGDGPVDEDFGIGQTCWVGTGQCQSSGAWFCNTAGGHECNAPLLEPGAEICGNWIDEDCDGAYDECPCVAVERCDGQDNDCDDIVDDVEGFCATTCDPSGVSTGTLTCEQQEYCDEFGCIPWGAIDVCVPPGEICDGRDNDCDGSTDEGCGGSGGGGGGGCMMLMQGDLAHRCYLEML